MSKKQTTEKTRKQRKARWIRVRNLMRQYPECAYNGDFYCNHVYDPQYPWTWVDFRFFHSRLKKYFAVAMVTAEYLALDRAEETAWEIAEAQFPRDDTDTPPENLDQLTDWINKPAPVFEQRHAAFKKALEETGTQSYPISPESIEVKDYGPVAVGVFATVNTQHIDEHVIREFIAKFRALGEPTTPGWTSKSEEVSISPKRLLTRV